MTLLIELVSGTRSLTLSLARLMSGLAGAAYKVCSPWLRSAQQPDGFLRCWRS